MKWIKFNEETYLGVDENSYSEIEVYVSTVEKIKIDTIKETISFWGKKTIQERVTKQIIFRVVLPVDFIGGGWQFYHKKTAITVIERFVKWFKDMKVNDIFKLTKNEQMDLVELESE